MTTTNCGEPVSSATGLCDSHARSASVVAAYWTDDAEFTDEEHWTAAERFAQIQRAITDIRADCVRLCGRAETEESR